jgi:hypothetical protein
MIGNYSGRRLISLVPIVLAAVLLAIIGPERLQHLQAKERWGILGCLLLAFIASVMLRRYLGNTRSGASVHMGKVGYGRPDRIPPTRVGLLYARCSGVTSPLHSSFIFPL